MIVECAGAGSAWGLDIGPGAASNQMPQVGYHAGPASAAPIFDEGYFSYPGVTVTAPSPAGYPGPFSPVSASTAVFIGWCPVCSVTSSTRWELATQAGAGLRREPAIGPLSTPHAAAFLTPGVGWVTGVRVRGGRSRPCIVGTTDGGRVWRVDYLAS
jgi:hypothetical protein